MQISLTIMSAHARRDKYSHLPKFINIEILCMCVCFLHCFQSHVAYNLARCQNSSCPCRPYLHSVYLQNLLIQSLRRHISQYYAVSV